MSTLCVIQARLGSTRFPGKALALLSGKPIIAHVVGRAKLIRGVDEIRIAAPSRDDALALAGASGASVFVSKVAEADVLGRFAALVEDLPWADTIMRLTGDCPMLEPRLCEQVLWLYRSDPGIEYASNVCAHSYVDGVDCEVFSRDALLWADRGATDAYDREHVTSWLRRHVRCATLKTSIDTEADLERVRALMVNA